MQTVIHSQKPQQSGLDTVVDMVVAPEVAFARLGEHATWVIAFLLAALLVLLGYALERPAIAQTALASAQHLLDTNSFYAGLSEAKKLAILQNARHPSTFATLASAVQLVATLLIAALLNSLLLLLGTVVLRGTPVFKALWAGSMNIAVPTIGIYTLVGGIIVALRGPASFETIRDINAAVPNLGSLIPDQAGVLAHGLGVITPFLIWGFFLNTSMMRSIAGVSPSRAWIFPALISGLAIALGALSASSGG